MEGLNPNNVSGTGSDSESYPTPEPMPTSTEGLEEYEHDYHEINEYDCRNFMSAKEYTSFMDRLYDFEVITQMQPSDERLKLMAAYATDSFMQTQEGFFEGTTVSDVSIEVSKESGMDCAMDSENELLARITPTVTVVQLNDDGSKTVLYEPLTLPTAHLTRWVLVEDIWYVNEDKK